MNKGCGQVNFATPFCYIPMMVIVRESSYARNDRRTIEVNGRLNGYKRKAHELLTSEDCLRHRWLRCIGPEAVFGQIKFNMAYRRFCKDKGTMDFAFFANAFNIKKMYSKTANRPKMGGGKCVP